MIMSAELPKILVIDDEIGPRESLRILLKRDYEVLCADSVARGLELLVQYHPETAAGPPDASYLFDRFVDLLAQSCAVPS